MNREQMDMQFIKINVVSSDSWAGKTVSELEKKDWKEQLKELKRRLTQIYI